MAPMVVEFALRSFMLVKRAGAAASGGSRGEADEAQSPAELREDGGCNSSDKAAILSSSLADDNNFA